MKQLLYNSCEWLVPIWALIILLLCATPGQYLPTAGWMELLSLDKWVHAGIFFVLNSLLWLLTLKKGYQLRKFIFYTLLCVIYGIILEVMQARIFTDRAYDEYDMIANSAGALLVFPFRKQIGKGIKRVNPDQRGL